MTAISRLRFLSGLASCAAAGGCRGLAGSASFGRPDVRFGVVSDIHLRNPGDEETFLRALEYFRDRGVDAVMIAGDIADQGRIPQLVRCGDCWRKVFPGNRAPDGRPVEKLFIYGNHDTEAWKWGKKKEELEDPALRAVAIGNGHLEAAWEEAFGEKYEPIWMKSVRGFTFIGAHWRSMKDLPAFLKAQADAIDPRKPFFYVQHAHPKDTCIGPWAWGHDDGTSTAALSALPNAVAFSGHSHYALTDERTVWQGSFTSINTASLRYISSDYSLRENASGNSYAYRGEKRKRVMDGTSPVRTGESRQGMVVSVYGETLAIERRDFLANERVDEDWVVTVPCREDRSFAVRAARRSAPAFDADAKVSVTMTDAVVKVSFPAARTVDGCRVFEYEVTATLVEDGVDLVQAQRRIMAPDFFRPVSKVGASASCAFSRSELPNKGHYVFSVRPIECFGKKGTVLVSDEILVE